MATRVLVWGENLHERNEPAVAAMYPLGMHQAIAALLRQSPEIEVQVATLEEPEHGLSEERLAATDVLVWWGHKAHQQVRDEVVDRVLDHVWQGMGLIALHSAHFSKIFRRLMGTPCTLKWREAGERERVWVVNPRHPIAAGLPESFVIDTEEMYGEPFDVPEPLETVFISWFEGGEVFRSGMTFRRGAGNIFYFQPGHQTYPTFYHPQVGQVLRNAALWAHNRQPRRAEVHRCPMVPAAEAPETIGRC